MLIYAQFAREFDYDEEYIDWQLDMDRIFFHMEYLRDNPPAGMMLKLFFESLGDKKGKSNNKTPRATNNGSIQKRPTFKTKEEQDNWEEEQLAALIQIFGGSGGIVRKRKKGGK